MVVTWKYAVYQSVNQSVYYPAHKELKWLWLESMQSVSQWTNQSITLPTKNWNGCDSKVCSQSLIQSVSQSVSLLLTLHTKKMKNLWLESLQSVNQSVCCSPWSQRMERKIVMICNSGQSVNQSVIAPKPSVHCHVLAYYKDTFYLTLFCQGTCTDCAIFCEDRLVHREYKPTQNLSFS